MRFAETAKAPAASASSGWRRSCWGWSAPLAACRGRSRRSTLFLLGKPLQIPLQKNQILPRSKRRIPAPAVPAHQPPGLTHRRERLLHRVWARIHHAPGLARQQQRTSPHLPQPLANLRQPLRLHIPPRPRPQPRRKLHRPLHQPPRPLQLLHPRLLCVLAHTPSSSRSRFVIARDVPAIPR